MFVAKTLLFPSFSISTIAASSHSFSEHYSMTLVVAVLEALNAYDTGGICSAVNALCYCVTTGYDLGADSFLLLADTHI